HGRNRLQLNRRRNGVTLVGDRAQQRIGQPECRKGHDNLRMGARPFVPKDGQSQPNERSYGGRNRLRQGDWINDSSRIIPEALAPNGALAGIASATRGSMQTSRYTRCPIYEKRLATMLPAFGRAIGMRWLAELGLVWAVAL